MKQLPLVSRVVFVDWHGVLSRDPFWISILHSSTHPLRAQLQERLGEIFAHQSTAHEWMRGILSSQDIISEMGIWLDRRFRSDFLARRLDIDCARMRVNVELFEVLRTIKGSMLVVLATDNMDCFARTFDQARSRRRPPAPTADTLADWAIICDDIVCSSGVGALKAEDPVGFFGPWLTDYGLQFCDALLIDDRADNCAAFREQGGATVQWKMGVSDVDEIVESVERWLHTPAPVGT